MSEKVMKKWKRFFFSPTLEKKSKSGKIAYIALVAALNVVANAFLEIKFLDVQFSLTIFVAALSGVLIGAAFGFVACFVGDLAGFLYNSGGGAYMPWIGLSTGLIALCFGVLVGNGKQSGWRFYGRIGLSCLLTFVVCTVGITTTALWILYSKIGYWEYLVTRLFVIGQIWNSLVNYALVFIALPLIKKRTTGARP